MNQPTKPTSSVATNWDEIKGFSKREFEPPGADQFPFAWDIHSKVLIILCQLRFMASKMADGANIRVVIHKNGGFAVEGHSDTSLHYGVEFEHQEGVRYGRAVDASVEQQAPDGGDWAPWPCDKQFLLIHRMVGPHFGIGAYPYWNRPGSHLDYRGPGRGVQGQPETVKDRTPAIWRRDPEGKYKFYGFWQPSELIRDVLGDD